MEETQFLEINDVTRTIDVPEDLLLGVLGDKDVERVYFRCPKIVGDNINLAEHQIYVKYVTAPDKSGERYDKKEPGIYHCQDVIDEGEHITFSWRLSGHVFEKEGFIAFSVLASDGEVTRWNTFPAIGTVLITIPGGLEEVAEKYPDIILQLMQTIEMADDIQSQVDQAVQAKNTAIENANISTNNAEETEADRAETENSKNIAGVYMQQAIEASNKSEEALNQFLNTLSAQPKRYYRLSVEEMQAIENPHEGDQCYVVDLQNSRTAIYFYDADDIDGDNVNPEWQFLGNAEFAQMDRSTLLKILNLATVALTGSYNDLLDIPNRYNSPIVLDGTADTVLWDYRQSDTAVVTLTEDKAIEISNPYNGCIACIQCYGGQLDFSDETLYRKSATFDYIEPLEAEHIMYTLIYNAGKWDVTAMVYAGGEASA